MFGKSLPLRLNQLDGVFRDYADKKDGKPSKMLVLKAEISRPIAPIINIPKKT
jgi:hypothetical protein